MASDPNRVWPIIYLIKPCAFRLGISWSSVSRASVVYCNKIKQTIPSIYHLKLGPVAGPYLTHSSKFCTKELVSVSLSDAIKLVKTRVNVWETCAMGNKPYTYRFNLKKENNMP